MKGLRSHRPTFSPNSPTRLCDLRNLLSETQRGVSRWAVCVQIHGHHLKLPPPSEDRLPNPTRPKPMSQVVPPQVWYRPHSIDRPSGLQAMYPFVPTRSMPSSSERQWNQ